MPAANDDSQTTSQSTPPDQTSTHTTSPCDEVVKLFRDKSREGQQQRKSSLSCRREEQVYLRSKSPQPLRRTWTRSSYMTEFFGPRENGGTKRLSLMERISDQAEMERPTKRLTAEKERSEPEAAPQRQGN